MGLGVGNLARLAKRKRAVAPEGTTANLPTVRCLSHPADRKNTVQIANRLRSGLGLGLGLGRAACSVSYITHCKSGRTGC